MDQVLEPDLVIDGRGLKKVRQKLRKLQQNLRKKERTPTVIDIEPAPVDIELSMDERRVLFSLGHPWSTSKDIWPLDGKDLKRARFLVSKGLAELYGGAGSGRYYYRRTQAGQLYARRIARPPHPLP